jgi:hypothetical protein
MSILFAMSSNSIEDTNRIPIVSSTDRKSPPPPPKRIYGIMIIYLIIKNEYE